MAVAAGIAVLVVVAASWIVFRDGDEGSESTDAPAPEATSETTEPPATTGDDGAAPAPAPTAAPSPTAAPAPVLEDGRHPTYLTGIDVGARTIEVDVIQFLTGDAAVAAHDAAHPDQPGGPPNDYFIVNDNPRLRVLPVAADVTVTMLDWDGGFVPMPVAFEDLPAHLSGDLNADDGRLWPTPLWVTVADGAVTTIEEQYIP